jgi:hypothetical protein
MRKKSNKKPNNWNHHIEGQKDTQRVRTEEWRELVPLMVGSYFNHSPSNVTCMYIPYRDSSRFTLCIFCQNFALLCLHIVYCIAWIFSCSYGITMKGSPWSNASWSLKLMKMNISFICCTFLKCTYSMRMFINGINVDRCDEYCKLWKSVTIEVLKNFVKLCFEFKYLQEPIKMNIEKQLWINHDHGFFKMFVGIDCMHYVLQKLFGFLVILI